MEDTWKIAKNGYGYHDVDAGLDDADPNNGRGSGDKPTGSLVTSFSTVVKQFVVDYTSPTFEPLMEHEVNGLDYRYVYGNDRLSVNITGVETSSGNLIETGNQIRLYYHMDYLGTADYLTSPVSLKVTSWTHYNEWGEITHNAVLKTGKRELDLVKRYATHDYDAVLGMYYAKARFYDAENRRFAAVDPILDPSQFDLVELVVDAKLLTQYTYVADNPLTNIDPTGMVITPANVVGAVIGALGGAVVGTAIANYFDLQGCARALAVAGGTGLMTVVGWFAGPAVYKAIKPIVIKAIAAGQLIINNATSWILEALGITQPAPIGTTFKYGTLIRNTGKAVINWVNVTRHGVDRMAERGVTQWMVELWVKTGKAILQTGGKIMYVTRQGVAVLSKEGRLVTAYTSAQFDEAIKALVKQLFGY